MPSTGEIESAAPQLSLRTESPYLFACGFVFLFCVFIARPFADRGFIDDWSYSYVALQLAKTGHFHYSGWGSPSIVLQCLWAAPWIRLFGFSFNLLRLISLPGSLIFVLLTYLLARRIGLSAQFALFGTLIVATSPLFIPVAASFMTEPYACPLTMLAIYAAVCAAETSNPARAGVWLWVLTVASILGGSDRQTVWVVPMSLIPYLFWKRRNERLFRLQAVAAIMLTLAALIIVVKNFNPVYAPTSLSKQQLVAILRREGFYTIRRIVSVFLVALWLSLPALLCAFAFWKRLTRKQLGIILAITIAVAPLLMIGSRGMVPFLGNILTVHGILEYATDGLGLKPTLLSRPVQRLLTGFLVLVLVSWGVLAYTKRLRLDLFRRPSGIIFLISVCAYTPLLIPPGLVDLIFDRYSLPIFPLITICALWSIQDQVKKIPAAAYACLAIFAAYGIVTTHDYYATLRARDAAVAALEKRHVPLDEISGGFEHDGFTELQLAHKIGTLMYRQIFDEQKFWFWYFTPALRHEYVPVTYRLNDPVKDPLLQVPFTTWTYPFHRKIAMVKQEDL